MQFGSYFHSFVIKVIAEIWGRGNIAKKKSNGLRNTINKTFINNPPRLTKPYLEEQEAKWLNCDPLIPTITVEYKHPSQFTD